MHSVRDDAHNGVERFLIHQANLEALANHAAVAIGNAQAYEQQRLEREQASRRADQLARFSEISSAFRTNRSLHEVLEDIVYGIAESVGYDVVLISLVRDNPPLIHHEVGAGIPIMELEELQKQLVTISKTKQE